MNEEIKNAIEVGLADLKSKFEAKETDVKAMQISIDDLTSKIDGIKEPTDYSETLEKMQKHLDGLDLKLQKGKKTISEKSFYDHLGDALKGGSENLSKLMDKKMRSTSIEVKAGEEFLNPGNFTGGTGNVETRGVHAGSYAPIWLRNFMPNNTTRKGTIQYLKENGWNGAAGVWDGSGDISALTDKPGVTPNFDLVTGVVEWIAGIAVVKREMLDDLEWLRGYLSRKLQTGKRGLFVAENARILATFDANSTVYDGTKTNLVEALYDAAFGQLRDEYNNPSFAIVNNRDLVNLIALNKATGSGEYDLPIGTVANVNGVLSIGGVPLVGLPNVAPNVFYVIDANETEFVSRMSPEIAFSDEDDKNFRKNLITVRAEERILPIVFDNTAVIKGDITPTP